MINYYKVSITKDQLNSAKNTAQLCVWKLKVAASCEKNQPNEKKVAAFVHPVVFL